MIVEADSIGRAMRNSIEERRTQGTLQTNGNLMLLAAIDCMMVGRVADGKAVAARSVEFYEAAIACDERPRGRDYHADGTPAVRYEYCAWAYWVAESKHHQQYYDLAVEHTDRLHTGRKLSRVDLEIDLPLYLSTGRFDRVVELLEPARVNVDRITPRGVGKSMLKMAGLLARYRLRGDVTRQDLDAAIDIFLRQRMLEWISGPGTFHLVRWIKILLWDFCEGKKPPSHEVLGRCESYLSGQPADAR